MSSSPSNVDLDSKSASQMTTALPGYSKVEAFSPSGRMSRVRYFAYSLNLGFLITAVGLAASVFIGYIGIILALVALVAMLMLFSVQRCHDFNRSGWFAVLALVPLVGLALYCIPGTVGNNNWGNEPEPNSPAVFIAACLAPVMIISLCARYFR
jgi:uncharacterized membrane protein YhaH (DUF805 family)